MKAIRIMLFCIAFLVLASGCTTNQQTNTNEQKTDSVVSELNGTPNGTQTDSAIFTGEEPIKPYFAAKNAGSAKELIGDILVVSIFMEDPETEITSQLENEMLEEVRKAADWLENETKKRGKTAKIITGKDDAELKIRYQHPNVITDEVGIPYDDVLLLMKKLKFGSYYNRLSEKYNTQNVAFILHFNKNGRSIAYPSGALEMWNSELMSSDEANEAEYAYFDICMVYSMIYWEPSKYGLYVHELLHLFGAADLYYSDFYEDTRGEDAVNMYMEKHSLISKYFPNEVMLRSSLPIEIGDLTAYLIGWEETVPIKFAYFLNNPS